MPPRSKPTWIRIALRTKTGSLHQFTSSRTLQRMSMYWSYVARNRLRWSASETALQVLRERSQRDLAHADIGITSAVLRRIADAGVVEVSVPYVGEGVGWEARILPWEFLLSAATYSYRLNRSLLVVRCLECDSRRRRPTAPRELLVVESAPGRLSGFYGFDGERQLVANYLGFPDPAIVCDPTPDELQDKVRALRPDVIHLAGVDTHQGNRLLERKEKWVEMMQGDGYFLRDANGVAKSVDYQDLARRLRAPRHPAALVACNFYYSAARVAPMAVAEGARAALGFQDEIDDDLAEFFFAEFYLAWRLLGWDVLGAFQSALAAMGDRLQNMRGTGIVLWSRCSLLNAPPARAAKARQARLAEVRQAVIPAPRDGRWAKVLDVDCRPHENVNYSVLHNAGAGLFRYFTIRKKRPGLIGAVQVEVTLFVGADSFAFRNSFEMQDPVLSVAERVKVPLTSVFARSIRESVHTSLLVRVSCSGEEVYCQTHRVTLLAVDEWRDDADFYWLPSFVLPRDPAVSRLIESAQNYLKAICDDPGAGFDGYQAVDTSPRAADPFSGVHRQVQAIWSALLYEAPLTYINPPPTFTERSQRLRTPSEVVARRAGTCIDLALLLAACLEFTGISPTLFLLEGHAFPGYWRSEESQRNFIECRYGPAPPVRDTEGQSRFLSRPPRGWVLNRDGYDEVIQLVSRGDLIPLETVWLTQHKSFREAIQAGVENLRSKREFESMLDISGARLDNVTPLPIAGLSE